MHESGLTVWRQSTSLEFGGPLVESTAPMAGETSEAREPSVSVVVVNYRTPDLTIAAVRSVLAEPETLEVVVVDNHSGDGSTTRIAEAFGQEPRVQVVPNHVNVGFGRANNLGVSRAKGRFVFLLNSDARLHPGSFRRLLEAWGQVERPGILAPAVYRGDGKTIQAEAHGPFPTALGLLTRKTTRYGTTTTPDWVSGAAMLLERETYLEVGGFDPDFFLYYEDVVLCHQIRRRGLTIHRVLDAGVTHDEGGSSSDRVRKAAIYFDAQTLMLRKLGEPEWAIALVRLVRWPYRIAKWLAGAR